MFAPIPFNVCILKMLACKNQKLPHFCYKTQYHFNSEKMTYITIKILSSNLFHWATWLFQSQKYFGIFFLYLCLEQYNTTWFTLMSKRVFPWRVQYSSHFPYLHISSPASAVSACISSAACSGCQMAPLRFAPSRQLHIACRYFIRHKPEWEWDVSVFQRKKRQYTRIGQ